MILLAALLLALAPVSGPRASTVCYGHPVPAPVVERFVAPSCRWCAGHRGLRYATRPATPVRPAAPGIVRFAGPVVGARWVTVEHADGLRSSYGPLSTVAVTTGRTVLRSTVLGLTQGELHVGLRRGQQYLDPEAWFHRLRVVVRLVAPGAPAPRGVACAVSASARASPGAEGRRGIG